jgi:mono/diheme cytochrome c family protein
MTAAPLEPAGMVVYVARRPAEPGAVAKQENATMKTRVPQVVFVMWMAALAGLTLAAPAASGPDGQALFLQYCKGCHGENGKGDTPLARKIRAPDFTQAKVQEALKDDAITRALRSGVQKDGVVRMKGFGERLSAEEIQALVKHLRSLAKP